jgi:hypothetical protein
MDNWYKTSRATIQENIYVSHNRLEIHWHLIYERFTIQRNYPPELRMVGC